MSADEQARDPGARQRLVEGWLPLAQQANQRYGWGLDGAALEALILRAAARLGQARTSLEAYAALWGACRDVMPRA